MSYVRVGIQGTSAGGEVWSVNPVFDPNGEWETSVNQAALDAAAQAIANLNPGTNLVGSLSTALSITGARLEVRADADDHLLAISIAARSTPLAGAGVPKTPAQCAIVASLRTNSPGGSGRGRLYWPCIANNINSSLRLDTSVTTAILADMKTYLAAMQSALATEFPLIGFDLAVRSKTTGSTPHVVRIQMGNVIDTQRRRRDAYPESYVSVSVP